MVTPAEVEIRPIGCTMVSSKRSLSVLPRDLMLCSGIMQSPSTSPFDYRAWAFMLEHAESLQRSGNRLRLTSDAKRWDSRVLSLFGERFGMGLSAWTLWNQFNIVHIADAGQFIRGTGVSPAGPYSGASLSRSVPGSFEAPDYFCLDRSSTGVIAESKGTTGPPGGISRYERDKAKRQTGAVKLVGVPLRATDACLALCTNIRSEDAKPRTWKDSGVDVVDPITDDDAVPVELSPDDITVASYAKFFQFIGLGVVGYAIQAGLYPVIPHLEYLEVSPYRNAQMKVLDERVVVLAEVFGMRFGLLSAVAEQLLNRPRMGVTGRVAEVLAKSIAWRNLDDEDLPKGAFVLPNGVVGLPVGEPH